MSSERESQGVAGAERMLEAVAKHIYPLIYIALLIYQGNQVTILRERLTNVEVLTYGIHARVRTEKEE